MAEVLRPVYQDRAGRVRLVIYEKVLDERTTEHKRTFFRDDLDPYFSAEDVFDAQHLVKKAEMVSWRLHVKRLD